jgi:hypothetical protein
VITASQVDSEGRNAVLAMAADVQKVESTMQQIDQLEQSLLLLSSDQSPSQSPSKAIEMKAQIKVRYLVLCVPFQSLFFACCCCCFFGNPKNTPPFSP